MPGDGANSGTDPGAKDAREQLEKHLACPRQAWLLGAGISKNGGVPLIAALTAAVVSRMSASERKPLLDRLLAELPDNAHVEHMLTRIGDYVALAEGSKNQKITLNGAEATVGELRSLHIEVVNHVAETVRWGHFPAEGEVAARNGKLGAPIISVAEHADFVRAVFDSTQAGLHDRRGPVWFFTTNYDTLFEDALALHGVAYWDGFAGGAVAFRGHRFGDREPTGGVRAHVVKLHGSIDWYTTDDGRVWRVRDGDLYPVRNGRVLIYPQATKYAATQLDPFAAQFELLRRALSVSEDNVLAVCGYSFGDEHINLEIESALARPDSKTTLLAFCRQGDALAKCLERWRSSPWGRRVYVATEQALYVGSGAAVSKAPATAPLSWWTFSGVTELLRNGCQESRP